MSHEDLRDFFVASVSVAGALIGLLFVAISVAADRLDEKDELQVHRVRANAALIAFVNPLTVGLFALIPGEQLGHVAVAVAIVGLFFVLGSLLSLIRVRHIQRPGLHDAAVLLTLLATFSSQLVAGLDATSAPDELGPLRTIAVLIVICFLVGIARAWELIGGPSTGFRNEIAVRVRHRTSGHDRADAGGSSRPSTSDDG